MTSQKVNTEKALDQGAGHEVKCSETEKKTERYIFLAVHRLQGALVSNFFIVELGMSINLLNGGGRAQGVHNWNECLKVKIYSNVIGGLH